MRTRTEMFGGYHVSILSGGTAVTITHPDAREVFLQGDDACALVDEYDDLAADIANNPASRAARLGERQIADDLFGAYFD